MGIGVEILWITIAAVISFFIGILLDVFLPGQFRVRVQLLKKKLSRWRENPAYGIGIASRLDFKEERELQETERTLQQIFAKKGPTKRGGEIHFKNAQHRYDANIKIQLAFDEDEDQGIFRVYSINITADSKTSYREIRNQIDDLRSSLDEVEKELIRNLDLLIARRLLYVETENLKELSDILENLEANQVTGIVKGTNVKFAYYGNRLTIEDTIDSTTLQWFKNIIAYVG